MVVMFVNGPPALVARCRMKSDSLFELSVNETRMPLPESAALMLVGAFGGVTGPPEGVVTLATHGPSRGRVHLRPGRHHAEGYGADSSSMPSKEEGEP